MSSKAPAQSIVQQCAEIEREMTALTKELRQKTAELKAFYKVYHEKHEKLSDEWHKLFDTIADDDATRKSYWDLTEDIQREFT